MKGIILEKYKGIFIIFPDIGFPGYLIYFNSGYIFNETYKNKVSAGVLISENLVHSGIT